MKALHILIVLLLCAIIGSLVYLGITDIELATQQQTVHITNDRFF